MLVIGGSRWLVVINNDSWLFLEDLHSSCLLFMVFSGS